MLNVDDLKPFGYIGTIVEKLEQDGLLTKSKEFGGKSIYFKNKYCISFFIKHEKTLFYNFDYILTYDDLYGHFCGLDNLYITNQDEHVTWLEVKLKNFSGLSNLIVVKYNNPIYNDYIQRLN